MLRSLPVSDPASSATASATANDCCVEGGPQDRWGMFSYPLFERLKAEAPEFEQVAAFQAGGAASASGAVGINDAAKPLRVEYVTGNYFSTLGVGAFGGPRVHRRATTRRRPRRSACIEPSRRGRTTYGADPSVVGATFVVAGTSGHDRRGRAAPGSSAKRCAAIRPTSGCRCNRSRSSTATARCCASRSSAWLRVDRPPPAGRLHRRHRAPADDGLLAPAGSNTTPAIPPTGCRT